MMIRLKWAVRKGVFAFFCLPLEPILAGTSLEHVAEAKHCVGGALLWPREDLVISDDEWTVLSDLLVRAYKALTQNAVPEPLLDHDDRLRLNQTMHVSKKFMEAWISVAITKERTVEEVEAEIPFPWDYRVSRDAIVEVDSSRVVYLPPSDEIDQAKRVWIDAYDATNGGRDPVRNEVAREAWTDIEFIQHHSHQIMRILEEWSTLAKGPQDEEGLPQQGAQV